MTGRLQGKVAFVTGGGSGIGEATCLKFAKEGARVAVVDRDAEAARKVVGVIEGNGGAAVAIGADVANATDVETAVRTAVSTFGRIDAAVNNAGVPGGYAKVADLEDDAWQRTIDVNLSGVFLCLKYQLRAMQEQGGGGAIVNMASAGVLKVSAPQPDYIASKSGVVGITRSAAADYGKAGVRVNAVLPGPVATPMLMAGFNARNRSLDEMGAKFPLGRIGQADEIANLAVWLCSDEASLITGVAVAADAGYHLV
ncbi:SDR family NAD(P)-dependent oxidoreductase [Georgenia sp. AZ-5]|uniref:SDR family NAD(P)-dependent oxidoreductase n=1 Tax=Georgenia sp. AZ-5 TaxID=3367526 RepID=UPI0037552E9E